MGIVAKVAGAAIGTAAVAATSALVGERAGEGIDRFLHDPNVGPGWVTGDRPWVDPNAAKKAATVAKQQAAADAMILGADVKPWTPQP